MATSPIQRIRQIDRILRELEDVTELAIRRFKYQTFKDNTPALDHGGRDLAISNLWKFRDSLAIAWNLQDVVIPSDSIEEDA
jgi:hypothetical protein